MTIVDIAKTWLGTPYQHQAKVKGVGVDCGQLLLAVYAEAGLIPELTAGDYVPDWHLNQHDELYLGFVEKYADRIAVDDVKSGDIALFKFGHTVSHGGIVLDYPQIIHAYRPSGCVTISDCTQGKLAGRLYGFYHVRGA